MIVIVIGTNRPESTTRQVALHVMEIYRELEVSVRLLDLGDLPPEVFTPASYEHKPEAIQRFNEILVQASGIVVVCPEYNGGMPGVLKYFIDLLKFPETLENRAACFIGLSSGVWGGLRPVEQLEQVFGYRKAYVFPERVFLPRVQNAFGSDGKICHPEALERLRSQATGFIKFVERLQGIKLRS